MSEKKVSGTREWAEHNANLYEGCSNGCRYCYARYNAVHRFHRKTPSSWPIMDINKDRIHKLLPKVDGRYMFPTQHDITPETVENCTHYLNNNLNNGSRFLIVTKPNFDVVRFMCAALARHKEKIMWRFTITAVDEDLLAHWEPGAPRFPERLAALAYACGAGFETSVSAEPLLDTGREADKLISLVLPYCTYGIWLGPMNKIDQRVKVENEEDGGHVEIMKLRHRKEAWELLYSEWGREPKVLWKNEAKEMLGLPLNERAGEDR